jgi:hypothetical protein
MDNRLSIAAGLALFSSREKGKGLPKRGSDDTSFCCREVHLELLEDHEQKEFADRARGRWKKMEGIANNTEFVLC